MSRFTIGLGTVIGILATAGSVGGSHAAKAAPSQDRGWRQPIRWAASDPAESEGEDAGLHLSAAELEQAMAAVHVYERGQDPAQLDLLSGYIRSILSDDPRREEMAGRLAALLNSDATLDGKRFVLRQLAVLQSKAQVSAVAALLSDGELSHLARHVLEQTGGAEVIQALRDAMPRANGVLKAGMMNSLAVLGDRSAAASFIKLMTDSDPEVASAAIAGLGKLGGPEADEALMATHVPEALEPTLAKARIAAAYNALASGRTESAVAQFQVCYEAGQPAPVRMAALRGLAEARKYEVLPLLLDSLADPALRPAAIASLDTLRGAAATEAVARKLPELDEAGKIASLAALGRRGDLVARTAVLGLLSDPSEAVRIAAIDALETLGSGEIVPQLVPFLTGAEPERQAVLNTLAGMPAEGVDAALLSAAETADKAARLLLMEALKQRHAAVTAPELVRFARDGDGDVRLAALDAVASLGDLSTLPALIQLVVDAQRPEEREAASAAVQAVCGRAEDKKACYEAISSAIAGAAPENKHVLLPLATAAPTDSARAFLLSQISSSDTATAQAAARALGRWPDSTPADDLLHVGKTAEVAEVREAALEGYVRLAGLPSDRPASETVAMYHTALDAASSTEVKEAALQGLASTPVPEALALAVSYLEDPALGDAAARCVIDLAKAMGAQYPAETRGALERVLALAADEYIRSQARIALDTVGASGGV